MTRSMRARQLPAAAPYQTAAKRFELRLIAAQLDAWRAIAARQSVSLADLVRVAVVLAGELPPGHVRDYIERACAPRLDCQGARLRSKMRNQGGAQSSLARRQVEPTRR